MHKCVFTKKHGRKYYIELAAQPDSQLFFNSEIPYYGTARLSLPPTDATADKENHDNTSFMLVTSLWFGERFYFGVKCKVI
jgi:hypothetical protein